MAIRIQHRKLALIGVIVPILVLLVYVALRSGPLAPIAVTEASVQSHAIEPAIYGIATVEARYTYKIGPTFAGRVKSLNVDVGDLVKAGDVLGEMDPVDLVDKVHSGKAAFNRAEAAIQEAKAKLAFAKSQLERYEQLYASRFSSEETLAIKRQEFQITEAGLTVAQEELARVRADQNAIVAQRNNMFLLAPVDGIITSRDVNPGSTVVAGQAVVELIDPKSLWLNVRFDQISAFGLMTNLPANIILRSYNGQSLKGRVLRLEPKADAVTEEVLAKIVFDNVPSPLPPIGELAGVTVKLPALAAGSVIPNAAVKYKDSQSGVWQVKNGGLRFRPVKLGRSDLDGQVQVLDGLGVDDRVVVYSEKRLSARSRVYVVEHIPGVSQ